MVSKYKSIKYKGWNIRFEDVSFNNIQALYKKKSMEAMALGKTLTEAKTKAKSAINSIEKNLKN